MGGMTQFIDRHYRHFNAAVVKDAAQAYRAHLDQGGLMFMTLAGAMSTAELGLSSRGDDPAEQSARHFMHRGQSRRRPLQSGGPRSLCASAAGIES